MNARRRREAVQALIAQVEPDIRERIYIGEVIIEPSRADDPPVLTDRHGRLLRGSGQRERALSPWALGKLRWGLPRDYVDRMEAIRGGSSTELRRFFEMMLGRVR